MVDVLTKKQRSYNMSRIRASETKIELKLKPLLKSLGFVYHPKNIIGNPDFINKKKKIAVFVDGCFWHKCPKHFKLPSSNKSFWKNKINRNAERDKEITKKLKKDDWKVIRIWGHNLKTSRKSYKF